MSTEVDGIKCIWNFDIFTVQDIEKRTNELIEKYRAMYDEIGNTSTEDVTYENVINRLANIECEYLTLRAPLEFPQHVFVNKEIRSASTSASQKLEEFDVEMSMRKDVFDKVVYYQEQNTSALKAMKPEVNRYVERLIKIGKRNGLHLSHDTQNQLKKIKTRVSELSITYQQNLNEENTVLEFSDDELTGLPDDFIHSLEKTENGKRKVTLKYPHYYPIVRKCQRPYTRFRIDKAFQSRCLKENTAILEELIRLRQQQADLLGYPTHSAYITEILMSKNSENVDCFLKTLQQKLLPLWQKEKAIMLEFREKECKENCVPFDEQINHWDFRYYMAMVEEKLYAVDQNKLKEFFPLHTVTNGLLGIYQELLGLKFEKVEGEHLMWHPDVLMYKVEDVKTEACLGYFFLDLFPREGKYGHAAVFQLQPGCVAPSGERQISVSAMLANFTKPTEDKPPLLDHKEVETYFHEFGHVMHQICAQADFAHFSGTEVERDFVEAPSQMLENWVWEEESLRRMSGHYTDNSPLPQEMIDKLVQSQKANAGILNLRLTALAIFDQVIHTTGQANTRELFDKLSEEILGIPAIPGTNTAASFEHLAGGYDAQYYCYLWSEVYSCDMYYSRFKDVGILDPEVGGAYRALILQPGGSKDAIDMLKEFLGREPNEDAFLKCKGIGSS